MKSTSMGDIKGIQQYRDTNSSNRFYKSIKSNAMRAGVLALASLFTVPSWGYVITQCSNGNYLKWKDNKVTLRPSASFNGTGWLQPLIDMIDEVEQHAGQLSMSVVTGDNSVGFDNGQSEIWWAGSVIVGGTERPAAATAYASCSKGITEMDVRFNNTWKWDLTQNLSNLTGIGGSKRSYRGVALHEIGHVIGLGHVTDTYSIMGSDTLHVHFEGDKGRHYFGEDSTRGATVLYGSSPIQQALLNDLSVTSFRHTGSKNGYSTHGPVRIFNSSDDVLTTFTDTNGVLGYRVNKGQAVKVEFGYENLGYAFQNNVRMRYYISTNNVISTGDRLISTQTNMQFASDVVSYWQKSLTIPSDLTSGNIYYLGVIIDYADGSSDFRSANNTSYIPIRIN